MSNSISALYFQHFSNSEPKRFPNSGRNNFLNLLTDENKKQLLKKQSNLNKVAT
jgi:hypothetical protein